MRRAARRALLAVLAAAARAEEPPVQPHKLRWNANLLGGSPEKRLKELLAAEPPYWRLAWGDEFEDCPGGKPDPAKWEHEYGYIRNHELQFYTPSSSKCHGGVLTITSDYHPTPRPYHGEKGDPLERKACVAEPRWDLKPEFCTKHGTGYHYSSDSLVSRSADPTLLHATERRPSYSPTNVPLRFGQCAAATAALAAAAAALPTAQHTPRYPPSQV